MNIKAVLQTPVPAVKTDAEARRSVGRAERILRRAIGLPRWRRREPLEELVVTILSQNTNDANRDAAFRRLKARYPDWELLLSADADEIEAHIRPAGLSKQKSRSIQSALEWVVQRFGGLTLEPLAEFPDEEAIQLLTEQRGVGVKTAAVLLAFAFERDLCPVDTHVHRIAQRLGWVPAGYSAEKTFWRLKPLIPKGSAAAFHLNLLRFGRNVCTARKPKCGQCPLWQECIWPAKGELQG